MTINVSPGKGYEWHSHKDTLTQEDTESGMSLEFAHSKVPLHRPCAADLDDCTTPQLVFRFTSKLRDRIAQWQNYLPNMRFDVSWWQEPQKFALIAWNYGPKLGKTRMGSDEGEDQWTLTMSVKGLWKKALLLLRLWNIWANDKEQTKKIVALLRSNL